MIGTANLLIEIGSFQWNNLLLDQSKNLDDLILAVEKIDDHEDIIYNHPDTYSLRVQLFYFYELFSLDEDMRNKFIPWLRHDYQKFLINLFGRRTSEKPSRTLLDMDNEFPNDANGLLCCGGPKVNRIVSCHLSWHNLHYNYVNSNVIIRASNYQYFVKYYEPRLLISLNSIRGLIQAGQVEVFIDRIDSPPIVAGRSAHDQKIHVHFTNGAALNIDGSWKHGTCNIPVAVCKQLVNWGFILPSKYGY